MFRLFPRGHALSMMFIIMVFAAFISLLTIQYFSFDSTIMVSEEDKHPKVTISMNEEHKECDLKAHLKKNIITDPYAVTAGKGYVIYTCRKNCGGFADRLQGIATAYSIAKQTGRLFRIEETVECSMTTFLRPSPGYNWTLDRNEIEGLSTCFLNTTWPSKPYNDFVQFVDVNVIFIQTNRATLKLKQNFREIFNTLFVFDSAIVNDMKKFQSTYVKNNKTVCAHIRVGKSANFDDSSYHNLGNISSVWQFLSMFDREGYVFYIASDSVSVINAARKRYKKRFVEIPGHIIHIDYRTDDYSCTGFRKLITDFAFLSQCDILLLTASKFGKRASELRHKQKDQYCFQNGTVFHCPFYSLKPLYSTENRKPLVGI